MVKGKLNIDPILSPVLRENAAVVLRKRGLQHIYLGSLLVNVHVNVLVFNHRHKVYILTFWKGSLLRNTIFFTFA